MRSLCVSLMLASLPGCRDQAVPGVCTEIFAAISVTALTQEGAPASGLTISARILRTGQSDTVRQLGFGGPGTYVVFDDNLRTRIRTNGDSVRITGSNGTVSFTEDFLFDVPGGCHVRKVAGPDTVIAM